MTEAALQRTKKSCYQFSVIHTAKIKQPFVFIYLAKLIPSLFSLYLSATMWNPPTHFTHAHGLLLSFLHTTWVNQHHYLLKLPRKRLFYSAIAHPCPETCPCRGQSRTAVSVQSQQEARAEMSSLTPGCAGSKLSAEVLFFLEWVNYSNPNSQVGESSQSRKCQVWCYSAWGHSVTLFLHVQLVTVTILRTA